MATLIKKKFIGNNQVDGQKILLEEGQDLRKVVNGVEINVVSDLNGKIKNEETRALAKEASLQTEIDAAEASIAKEITDRQTADSALDSKIAALQVEIDNEEVARANGDAALDARIDAIEAAAHYKHKHSIVDADITAGYVNLPHVIKANSLVAHIDRLAIHEGTAEDYTLSTVDIGTLSAPKHVTRVTFVNSLVSPGAEALAVGDNLYFKYEA